MEPFVAYPAAVDKAPKLAPLRCAVNPFQERALFFFFSNRLGCLGSLAISAIVTLALLMFFGLL